MSSNVLIQNATAFNINSKMDSINGNTVVDSDKTGIKLEPNEDNLFNLLEKLHSKANQMKSWTDLAKIMKQSVNEKRHIIDVNERNQLQKCLDTIQKNIRVTSLQSMVERLETICRQLGLKFSVPPQTSPKRVECFVHSEMYYVEILLEAPTGHVLDCKVAHQAEALSCVELTDVLQKGDFVEFTKHLEGLSAIYQINADKKNKTKAYLALHALEIDLSSLAELQNHQINDINNLVHKSPVGILEPRKGGHPMRLTYFVPPYDLIDLNTKSCLPLNVDVILEKGLGFSATICIESSSSHRLQHESLINTLKTPEGKNLPQFSALTALNSTQLPACFVLKLAKPLVTSLDILKKIKTDTNIDFNHELINKSEPIIQLIAKQLLVSKESQSNGPFYVMLPKQNHCYHLNEGCDKLDGVVITSIPITHPTHVPRILVHLRQQVLFNVIIGSFIRQTSKPEDISNIFEVTTTSMSNINIQFEHPTEESLATLDLDLRDVTNVKCKLYPINSISSFCSDDFASKVMQRCLSIPVTMRSIINKCKERAAALKEQMAREQPSQMSLNQNELYFSLNSSNGSLDQSLGGRQPSLQYLSQTLQQYNGNQSSQLQQQMNQQFMGQNNTLQGQQQNLQRFLAQKMQHQLSQEGSHQNRPQITLQQFQQQQQELLQQNQLLGQNTNGQKHNTMLMSMLSDIPAANSQMLSILKQQQQQQHLQQQIQLQQHLQYMQQQQQQTQQKPKKQRKRKITNDNLIRSPGSSTGKSPKRKLSDDDFSRDLPDDGLGPDAYQWGSDTSNACRPSSTPSSTASFIETIGSIKQEHMSGGTTPTSGGSDALNSYSYLNQRHPFESTQNDFNEFNSNELPLYGESGGEVMTDIKPTLSLDITQPLISAKSVNKRTAKRMKSDTSDDASGTGDEGHNEQLKIIKSLEDLHQKDSFSKFFPNKDSHGICGPDNTLKKTVMNNIKVSKASNKNDVRRCSSAGIESGSDQKRSTNLSNAEDIAELTASLKKERKRKRAESVDSLKGSNLCATSTTGRNPINSSNMCSESSMMPPPMTASIGDVTSSSCLPQMDANLLKMIPNIKMSPTSSSIGSSPSQTVMKISSSGKKSLIGSTVTSTSGNESKISKGFSNKLDKSSTLSSMLKNPKQNYSVSPKASDSENSSTLTPSLSPKGLTFKPSKSKASKSGLSSPGRTKDYNKSQIISGIKQKSGNISSTSSLSVSKSGSTAVSSSSSLSPGLSSSSMASSVSSSKQQTAKVAKISRKSSLTAVVDRLHQKQDATGLPIIQPGAPEGGRPESSSLSTSRPDTTSAPKISQSGGNKMTESKTKYSRTSDQFTIKANNSGGGLKMSITKTKLSATDNSNKIGPGGTGLFKTTTSKFTIPKLPKANSSSAARPISTSSSPSTATTTSTTSTTVTANPSVRRQINTNTKISGNIRANVSSSTHPSGPSVSPKGSTGTFNVPHNKPAFVDRHNIKTVGPNSSTNKSISLNKNLNDKFKSSPEPSSTTKNVHSTDSLTSPSNSFSVMAKSMAESSRPGVYSKFDSVALQLPVGYSRSVSVSGSSVSPQLPASTTSSLQSNKPIFSKSVSVNENENIERLLSNWGQTHESVTNESKIDSLAKSIAKSVDSISSPQNLIEKVGVSSSSDVKASTSTPSSPAEMALITDALQNPPPLIPTEAIDDSSEGGSGGSASVDANGECENSTQITLHSTELSRDCRPSASISSESISTVSANETLNEVSTSDNTKTDIENIESESSAVTQSRLATQLISENNKMTADDDEDGDGLIIDDPSIPPKPNRSTIGAIVDTVSSSTSRLSAANESQSKSSTSPTSSSTPVMISNTGVNLSSMTGTFGSVTSPSNHSTNSSMQRPSPYPIAEIDDDLMDEALIGSNE